MNWAHSSSSPLVSPSLSLEVTSVAALTASSSFCKCSTAIASHQPAGVRTASLGRAQRDVRPRSRSEAQQDE